MTSPSLMTVWLQLLALLAAEVGLVALAVWGLRQWGPSAAWRRTFCQAAIAAVLVITACELSGSARALGHWVVSALAPQARHEPNKQPSVRPASGPATEFVAHSPRSVDEADPSRPPSPPKQALPLGPTHAVLPSPDSEATSMGVLWLCVVWAAGAALAAVRACLAQCLCVIFRFRRPPVADPVLAGRVQALAQSLGIRRRVRVIESRRLTTPIAFGLVRPTVGLPPAFTREFDPPKQDAMLAHELAHLAAHDPAWCLLADVTVVLLWWHPGVWWLRRELHLASEMAADEASLLVTNGPRVLAECLVELGTRLTRPARLGQLRVSGFRSHLGRRVQQLVRLEERPWSPLPRRRAALVRILGPMAMTAIVVLCTAWAAPQAFTHGDNMKTMQLNWKRSLTTLALLAAFNGSETTVAVAQSDKPAPAPPSAPAVAPAVPTDAVDSTTNSKATEAPVAPEPPPLSPPTEEAFRKRYGLEGGGAALRPVTPRRPAASPERGAKLDAKLNQIVLDQITFEGLPLGEVLRFLSDESIKRDPEKNGVNFLINPNFRPATLTGAVDPATGLPQAAATEPFDMTEVIIKFNQPLRNITMKNLLDAIVTVADHPIEYKLEDYAVIFSAKPETAAGQPVVVPRPAMLPEAAQGPRHLLGFGPRPMQQSIASPSQAEPSRKRHWSAAELSDIKPQTFNVDFGGPVVSEQQGPAAAGKAGDFWNTVVEGFNDHFTKGDLKFAGGDPSPIEVEMINLGGSWSFSGEMGVKDPVLDTYTYPTGNKGGNSTVILRQVPAGKYNVYIYGHGPNAPYYGDYTLSVGEHQYGRKQTSPKKDAGEYTKWVEGIQYVRFSNVRVGADEEMRILIRPGGQVTDPSGRTFSDAMIAGMQLIPVK